MSITAMQSRVRLAPVANAAMPLICGISNPGTATNAYSNPSGRRIRAAFRYIQKRCIVPLIQDSSGGRHIISMGDVSILNTLARLPAILTNLQVRYDLQL